MPAIDTGLHKPSSSSTKVKLRITIPEDTFNRYEEHASKTGTTVETAIEKRLTSCVGHDAQRGIYLNDEHVAMLQKASGRLIDSPDKAVARLTELAGLMVGDVIIDIPLDVQRRIEARAKSFRKPYEDYLKREVGLCLLKIAGKLPW